MNPYTVLGVTAAATPDEIRAAYRRRAKETHPDAGGSDEAFRAVQDAYETLKRATPNHAHAHTHQAGGRRCPECGSDLFFGVCYPCTLQEYARRAARPRYERTRYQCVEETCFNVVAAQGVRCDECFERRRRRRAHRHPCVTTGCDRPARGPLLYCNNCRVRHRMEGTCSDCRECDVPLYRRGPHHDWRCARCLSRYEREDPYRDLRQNSAPEPEARPLASFTVHVTVPDRVASSMMPDTLECSRIELHRRDGGGYTMSVTMSWETPF